MRREEKGASEIYDWVFVEIGVRDKGGMGRCRGGGGRGVCGVSVGEKSVCSGHNGVLQGGIRVYEGDWFSATWNLIVSRTALERKFY